MIETPHKLSNVGQLSENSVMVRMKTMLYCSKPNTQLIKISASLSLSLDPTFSFSYSFSWNDVSNAQVNGVQILKQNHRFTFYLKDIFPRTSDRSIIPNTIRTNRKVTVNIYNQLYVQLSVTSQFTTNFFKFWLYSQYKLRWHLNDHLHQSLIILTHVHVNC